MTAASASRRSSCCPARSATTGLRSSSRRTPGRRTTTATSTETASAIPGTATTRFRASTSPGRFSTEASPTRFRGYEVGFLRWLYRTGKDVDFITDRQLDRLSAERLHTLYDLVVFLGHHEYTTTHEYNVTTRYRDLGGNLMFTSTTNFLYRAERHGRWLYRTEPWRALGRPESSLIGVQYLRNDGGKHQGHYLVTGAAAAPWAFRGTGLQNGDRFGHGGIEIDARTAASPPGTIVLATMPNLQGFGYSPEMTYYTPGQARRYSRPGRSTSPARRWSPRSRRCWRTSGSSWLDPEGQRKAARRPGCSPAVSRLLRQLA